LLALAFRLLGVLAIIDAIWDAGAPAATWEQGAIWPRQSDVAGVLRAPTPLIHVERQQCFVVFFCSIVIANIIKWSLVKASKKHHLTISGKSFPSDRKPRAGPIPGLAA
jgi:hypothetical protein